MLQPSPMVGRETEKAALVRHRQTGGWLCITGPGGVGKSRLVRELYPGSPLCDLADCDADSVLARVGAAVGMTGSVEVDALGEVLSALEGPLVIDRCGHLGSELLALATPLANASVLLLSRVRLDGFESLVVPPLSTEGDILESPAGQLFVNRGKIARSAWSPDPREVPIIREILERLDGLPLAIELAAARLKVMGTRQLLERLDQRFKLLAGRGGALLPVLQTTVELLEADDRRLLGALATFANGFDATDARLAAPDLDVDAGLLRLEDHHVLRTWDQGETRWYALYESVRDFARERFDGVFPTEGLLDRVFVELDRIPTPGLLSALDWFSAHQEDLWALHRAAVGTDPNTAEITALGLEMLLLMRGPAQVRRSLLTRSLQLGGDYADWLYLIAVDAQMAPADASRLERIIAEGRAPTGHRAPVLEANRRRLGGWAARCLSTQHCVDGDFDRGLSTARIAVELDPTRPRSYVVVAEAFLEQAHLEEAQEALMTGLEHARRAGNRREQSTVLWILAQVEAELGEIALAFDQVRESIDGYEALGDSRAAALGALVLTELQVQTGDFAAAAETLASTSRKLLGVGERQWRSHALAKQALVHACLGDVDAGSAHLREALAIALRFDVESERTQVLGFASTWQALFGDLDVAAELKDEVLRIGSERDRAELTRPLEASIAAGRAKAAAKEGNAKEVATHTDAAHRAMQARHYWLGGGHFIGCILTNQLGPGLLETPDLTVASDGMWFSLPDAEPTSMRSRHANRRVFMALVHAHESEPGRPVSIEALQAAGWPGERIVAAAGVSRVYTAIATLRRAGLRPLIVKSREGYALREDAVVRQLPS